MVKIKVTQFCVKNLKMKRKRNDLLERGFEDQIFSNFPAHNLNSKTIEINCITQNDWIKEIIWNQTDLRKLIPPFCLFDWDLLFAWNLYLCMIINNIKIFNFLIKLFQNWIIFIEQKGLFNFSPGDCIRSGWGFLASENFSKCWI